ncbi:hypothetical protein BN946_scf184493.g14 [Trametes cinnabarina]|uniref:PLD phosphodiesterase domain-containing protein n=1 Tax=Pycnoporus cinnabarinus TaxID=5643 RepID=A0A060SNH8_PYCCI|nr:hypothetical protein BN946_scf184493.g14 [Trametes cinnabarina]
MAQDMDDEVTQALRASLQESSHEAQFQADLQAAIEESKRALEAQTAAISPAQVAERSQPGPSAAASFLSQRAQDERARLERLKRRRPDVDLGPKPAANDSDDEIEEVIPPTAKRQHISPASRSDTRHANTGVAQQRSDQTHSSSDSGLFWDGEVRQTANVHVDRRKDTQHLFRLTEILQPNKEIEFAIVSAFCWNYAWVYDMFYAETPVIAVDHSPTGDASIKTILPNWIRTTPFLRNGFGCMHMKLFYKTGRLRVVVSTANLVDYDWRDIENTVWVQDVPKRSEPIASPSKTDKENFPTTMVILTGHTRLMKALIDMGAATPPGKELILECQGSSIGTYSSMWMNEFYRSARGESTQSWLEMTKARRAKVPYPPIKILFPTTQYVRQSVLGEAGGGTMFCRRKQWEATNFPRQLFHQSRSKRGRVLMHSKMILATFQDKRGTLDSDSRASTASQSASSQVDEDDGEREPLVGWVYVGSHNFTPSAWGTLSGSGFTPTLNVNNYELGVVLPLRTHDEADKIACWERPPPKYVLGQDEPWDGLEVVPRLTMLGN